MSFSIFTFDNNHNYTVYENDNIKNFNIIDSGNGNRLNVSNKFLQGKNSNINISIRFMQSNNEITLDYSELNIHLDILIVRDSKLQIGENLRSFGAYFHISENNFVTIGKNNLFAAGLKIFPWNGHIIYDLKTGENVNNGNFVKIGDHNWIGQDVRFLPDSGIANDTVVGMGSIVTHFFTKSNIVLAGIPAKIVRENIGWKWSKDRYI